MSRFRKELIGEHLFIDMVIDYNQELTPFTEIDKFSTNNSLTWHANEHNYIRRCQTLVLINVKDHSPQFC